MTAQYFKFRTASRDLPLVALRGSRFVPRFVCAKATVLVPHTSFYANPY